MPHSGNSQSDDIAANHSQKSLKASGSNKPHALSVKTAWEDSMGQRG